MDYNLYYPIDNNAFTNGGGSDLSWTTYHTTNGNETHSQNADPKFISTVTPNFRLQSTSPAINMGAALSLVLDYISTVVPQGSAPDVGAYEFILPASPSSLAQYKSDGTTAITSGAWLNETTAVFKFSMSSTNSADSLTPQIEIQPNGTAFTNSVTNSGDAVAYSISPVTGTVTVTGLTSGQTYHWQARVSNAAGQSAWVAMGGSPDFRVDATAPTNIGLSSITADSTTQLTILANTAEDTASGLNATPYQFQETSGNSGATSSSYQASATHIDSGLSPNTQYTYKVRAKDVDGNVSSYSSETSKYTLAPTPTNLSATVSLTSVALTVDSLANASAGISGYYFSRSGGGNSGWIQTNIWQDTGLFCGTSYTYLVRYRNGDGTETNTISITASTDSCPGGGSLMLLQLLQSNTNNQPSTQTTEDKQIQDARALIASLTKQIQDILNKTTTTFTFTKNLYFNNTDPDVKLLQQYLNTHGFPVATQGAGSPGKETTKFGNATRQALIKFQEAHADQILKPWFTKGTGIFGPMTRRFVNGN
jgi:hypothetical protein